MKKFTKLIALLLVLCTFASLVLACNKTEEPTAEAPTESETPTSKPTRKPTEAPTNPPTEDPIPEDVTVVDSYELLSYNGAEFDESKIDIGQESRMYVVKDTTAEAYESFKDQLADAGCYLYTTYEEGDHKFATFMTRKQILHTMLLHYNYDENDTANYAGAGATDHYEVRVMEDSRVTFGATGLKEDNVYEKTHDGFMLMLSDQADPWPGRMGFVYQLADGSFFVIDGGSWNSGVPAKTLMNIFREYAPDPNKIVIAGWLFTHIHSDHVGAFEQIAQNAAWRKKIIIEKLIYNMPNEEELAIQDKYKWQDGTTPTSSTKGITPSAERFNKAVKKMIVIEHVKAHSGQQFFLRDLTLTIDVAQDTILYSNDISAKNTNIESIGWHNSTSVVTRVDFKGKTAIYLGDTHQMSIKNTIVPLFSEIYETPEIVQTAHHGYTDTAANILYKYFKNVEMVLWPVRLGHFNGYMPDGSLYIEGGKWYGTGVAGSPIDGTGHDAFIPDKNTGSAANWNKDLLKEGITQVYLKKDICEVCDNFETWEFKSVDYNK